MDAAERRDFLAGTAEFATVSGGALEELAGALAEVTYEPDTTVFAEGDPGDRLLVVVDGRGDLSVKGPKGLVALTTVGPGDVTGLVALLSADAVRTATLTTSTAMRVLALDAADFRALLAEHPQLRAAFEAEAEHLQVSDFIKRVGPFATLDREARRWLATRLVRRTVPAGQTLICEGERGDSCFLIRSGRIEVVVGDPASGERALGTSGPGSIVGEAALLSDAPRSATVRAIKDAEVLELKRADLEAIANRDGAVAREMAHVYRLHDLPRRAAGVIVSERTTSEGETVTTLKHPEHLTYFRLSEGGRLVWELMDGTQNLRGLTLAYLERFGEFRPEVVMSIAAGLARARMIDVRPVTRPIGEEESRRSTLDRVLDRARRAVTKEIALRNVDAAITAAYRRGVRLLFTRGGQAVLAVIALGGLVAYVAVGSAAHHQLTEGRKELVLPLLAGQLAIILLHEAGHAFTVKRFGREINRAGVGWYWFSPVAFIDTSDMWLGTARERIVVTLAGPYTNLIVGGAISLTALIVDDESVQALLWLFALPAYIGVLVNLNPLLEFDGYHVLSDALDRPNLRSEALGWLGARLPHALRDRAELRAHRVDLLYGVASVLFILVMGVAFLIVYRVAVQGWMESIVPAEIASDAAWVLAPAVCVLAGLALVAELRAQRQTSF